MSNIPDKTGVYMFLDKNKKPLYIGRALSLKKRVSSYNRTPDPRLKEMRSLANKIEYIETDTIIESVILEANLIKKHWPKYNIRDRDNRSFIYIVIDRGDFPKPILVREREIKKIPSSSHIFGPYRSLAITKIILKIIRRIFPYSTCDFSGKPCFYYQIGLCPGVCVGEISKNDYRENIKNIILFLKGEKKMILKKLIKSEPETAMALKHIQDVSLILKSDYDQELSFNRIEAYDVSHLSGENAYGAMVVFVGNKADKSQYRLFKIKNAPDDLRSLEEMILRRLKHKEWSLPNIFLIDGGRPQIDFISGVFEKENVSIPLVGISKYGNDKLVFSKKTKASLKELIRSNKAVLLKAREESHRFALKSSRKKRVLPRK